MGTCDRINNNNRGKENEEYMNLRGSLNNSNQNQYRQRLFSDPIRNYPFSQMLQPLRRHTNHDNNNIYINNNNDLISNNSISNNNQIHLRVNQNYLNKNINNNENSKESNTNNINNNTSNSTARNNYLLQRRFSDSYCHAFRQSYMSSGQNGLLRHLTESLYRVEELSELDYEEIRNKYIPKYIIDWRLEIDPITKEKKWINMGSINLMDETNKKMIGEKINKNKYIDSNEIFYIKRLWLMQYLYKNFGIKTNENPTLIINRNNILKDSFRQFKTTKEFNLRRPIKIFFVDEVASDEGGVYRDWYSCLFKAILNKENKLFIQNTNKCLNKYTYLFYPKYPGINFEYFEFIGKLITKGFVDMMNINFKLNLVLSKQLLQKHIDLEDIQYYDLGLYKSLLFIKNEKNIENNEDLKDTRFTWIIRDENNNRKEIELIPNGKNIQLSDKNKNIFIEKVIYNETIKPYEEHIKHFRKGMILINADDKVGNIFTLDEFDFILSGQDEININDWKENTIYKGDFNSNHPVIKNFWECIENLNQNQLKKFLEFATGSPSVPIDGFANLKGMGGNVMKFSIEPYICFSSDNPCESEFRLIEAKTCFNRIILPYYKDKNEMNKAMNILLNNDTSFFGLE